MAEGDSRLLLDQSHADRLNSRPKQVFGSAAYSILRSDFVRQHRPGPRRNEAMMISEAGSEPSGGRKPLPLSVVAKHPIVTISYIPRPLALFCAGALAGAIAKTITAPLDRVKLLMQVQSIQGSKSTLQASSGMLQGLLDIAKKEGIRAFWKGNVPQVIRVVPYSAVQLTSYEYFKQLLADENGDLPIWKRLLASSLAAMTSTTATYPLDVIRLRLAVEAGQLTMVQCVKNIVKEEGFRAFYKGLGPACVGIAPYIALNFTAFDLFKKNLPENSAFVNAFMAATLATSVCYPLDTIRRQMQMKGSTYPNVVAAFFGIMALDGLRGLYRGWVPNLVKNLPNSSIRLATFDTAKSIMASANEVYDREAAKVKAPLSLRK